MDVPPPRERLRRVRTRDSNPRKTKRLRLREEYPVRPRKCNSKTHPRLVGELGPPEIRRRPALLSPSPSFTLESPTSLHNHDGNASSKCREIVSSPSESTRQAAGYPQPRCCFIETSKARRRKVPRQTSLFIIPFSSPLPKTKALPRPATGVSLIK